MKKILISFYIICLHTACSHATPDTLFAYRLASLKGEISLLYSPEAKSFIQKLTDNKNTTAALLGKWNADKTFCDSIFSEFRISPQISSLSIGLSGYKYDMQLDNGNSGYWAIPFQVAKAYGLKINSFIDERRDFKLATIVFAQALSDYYKIYNDWKLALAAYASSPAAVNKAIRMANTQINFDAIKIFLPKESQDIILQLTASVYIVNFYKEHQITMLTPKFIPTDKTMVYQWMSLNDVASELMINKDELASLNPIYKKKIIPKNAVGYELKFPLLVKESIYKIFALDYQPYPNEDIRGDAPELEFKNIPVKKFTDTANLDSTQKALLKTDSSLKTPIVQPQIKPIVKQTYATLTVRKGQSLGIIAQQNGVSISDLRKWNNIKGNTIYPGQKLKIYK